jgi:hypothetical protein
MGFVPILNWQFDEDILAPRRTRRPRSREGLKPAPTSFAPFGLFALDFSYFVLFLPFVVIFVFQVPYPREGLCS